MGWDHESFGEFLAARYLIERGMEVSSMMGLITHPGDPDKKLVPQLYGVAAWLASMSREIFRRIAEVDSQVLLRSDVGTVTDSDRAELTENLLAQFDNEEILDFDLRLRAYYAKLRHSGLADQLMPYLRECDRNVVARRVAIEIAEACETKAAQEVLVALALDSTQPLTLRAHSAYAVGKIGDTEARSRLKPLAVSDTHDDPDDELKGAALAAVWPDQMKAEELFASLTPPRRRHFIGSYRMFVSRELVKDIAPSDIPHALAWVDRQPPRHTLPSSFGDLIDAVLLKAQESFETPGVIGGLAAAVLSRIDNDGEIAGEWTCSALYKAWEARDSQRQSLLMEIVTLLEDRDNDVAGLFSLRSRLLLNKDLGWMIEHLNRPASSKRQAIWVRLIWAVFDIKKAGDVNSVLAASVRNSALAERFESLIKPVELASAAAIEMKSRRSEIEKSASLRRERAPLKPNPAERIEALLKACEAGGLDAWWRLSYWMAVEPSSGRFGGELESDLTALPGWEASGTDVRSRIVAAAKKYLMNHDPGDYSWILENTIWRPAYAGYRALRLLLGEMPDFLREMPSAVWRKWAPIVLAYPTGSDPRDEDPKKQLVSMAYRHASAEIVEWLRILMDKESVEGRRIWTVRVVQDCWDESLATAIFEKARDETLTAESMGSLLELLIDHDHEEASEFARSLITSPLPSEEAKRERAVAAALALVMNADDAGWSTVWPALRVDAEFGRRIAEALSGPARHGNNVEGKLTEDQLADLYIWLAKQYPHAEDPKREGVGFVGSRESIALWRDSLLAHLERRGTSCACEAIERIGREFPALEWLRWTLVQARGHARAETWTPPEPSAILELAANRRRRLVQSGEHLLDVIEESLRRLEKDLHDVNPDVKFLWNDPKIGGKIRYTPKDESSVSDYVKSHLDRDLKEMAVFVAREVEFRRLAGAGRGESTDILVELSSPGSDSELDRIKAVIEAKCSWSNDLRTALKEQLVGKYLKDTRCQHGVYLVGWFNCELWSNDDPRKSRAHRHDSKELQDQLDEEASKLSEGGYKVRVVFIDAGLRGST